MTPDKIAAAVRTIAAHITTPGQQPIFQSETQTRYALVDPLLRALDWDTAQPTDVRPEFRTRKGKADYALFNGGHKPIVLGEAKQLHTPSLDDARTQGAGYCRTSAARYLFVTNGQRWEVHDMYQTHDAPVAQFDVVRDTIDDIVQNAQLLQKERLKKPPPVTIAAWNPPPKSRPEKGQFPDNSEVPIPDWKALVVAVTRWLVHAHHLTPAHCPTRKTPKSDRYVVSLTPTHPSRKPFTQPGKVPFPDGQTCYVDAFDNATSNARAVRNLITATGQDPTQFHVWFS